MAMEMRRAVLRQPLRLGWILLFLVGCGTYNPTAGGTGVPQPATEISPVAGSVQTELSYVTGSVQFEQGKCCIGGTAGSTIRVTVQFSATSPSGSVSSMRVKAGNSTCEAQPSACSWTVAPLTAPAGGCL